MFIRITRRVEYVDTDGDTDRQDGPSTVYSCMWHAGVIALALLAACLVIGAPWLASLLTPLLKGFL
jgi:hypothetical protein